MNGLRCFTNGLEAMGLPWEVRCNLVLVTMDIAPERWACELLIGTDPPDNFPRTPPHWLHMPKQISLPNEKGRDSPLGAGYRRWSRVCPNWGSSTQDPVKRWAAQVRSLILVASVAE